MTQKMYILVLSCPDDIQYYGVAATRRLLKIIGLFCERAL